MAGAGMCLLAACNRQEVPVYGDVDALSLAGSDSIMHSFFSLPEEQMRDTVYIVFGTMGYPSGEARPVKIVQTNAGEPDAAVPGVHYVPFDDPEVAGSFAVAPGKTTARVPIILLRDKSLLTSSVCLKMALRKNECFEPMVESNATFRITTSSMPAPPEKWNYLWKDVWGVWGPKKMWFIINYLGFSKFDEQISDSAYKKYLNLKARTKLTEYNYANPDEPLCENPDKQHAEGEVCEDCVEFPL